MNLLNPRFIREYMILKSIKHNKKYKYFYYITKSISVGKFLKANK